jgi:hypothetical protein
MPVPGLATAVLKVTVPPLQIAVDDGVTITVGAAFEVIFIVMALERIMAVPPQTPVAVSSHFTTSLLINVDEVKVAFVAPLIGVVFTYH